jgi:hypothetical protein
MVDQFNTQRDMFSEAEVYALGIRASGERKKE